MRSKVAQNGSFAVNILNISHDAIIITDDSQSVLTFNKGAERIFGYPDHEIVGQPLGRLLPPSSIEIYRERFVDKPGIEDSIIQTDSEYKLVARRKDGTIFPCKVIISTVLDNGQKILISILRDISGDKRAEEALFRSEEKLKDYVKNSPEGIFLMDETGHFLEVNSAACRIIGYSQEKMLKLRFRDLLAEVSLIEGDAHLQKLKETGSATSDLWFNPKGGSKRYLSIAAIKLTDTRVLGFSKDNTRLKLDEELIKKLNKVLSKKVVRSEKRAAELVIANKELDYQNKEKQRKASELIMANKELAFQNREKQRRASELIMANKELAFQNSEKEKRAAELVIANKELLFQNSEKEKRAAELVIAKENAEESDRLKTAFLQNMSHEIRTPLNGIIGFSALLNDEGISKEEIRECTEAISESGKRLIEIISNVLDISKIQTGQVKVVQSPVLIHSMFSELVTLFSPAAKGKNLILNYRNQNNPICLIYSDYAKLYQIMHNLINNALKFTLNGRVDFGFEIKGDDIEIYVKDSGIGIPFELHELIFERFTQAEQSMIRNYEGAGLGLAISKGLVKLLGGKIWLESEPGEGSSFYITLPYAPPPVSTTDSVENDQIPHAVRASRIFGDQHGVAGEIRQKSSDKSKIVRPSFLFKDTRKTIFPGNNDEYPGQLLFLDRLNNMINKSSN